MSKFRPILAAINNLGYNIAEFFIPTLEPFTREFTIKKSFNFAKEITTNDSSLYLVGLDVNYFFTNIPLNETIYNFVCDLQNKISVM